MELKTNREKQAYRNGWYDGLEFFSKKMISAGAEKFLKHKVEELQAERKLLNTIHKDG